jgi:uncharacterized protein YfdQ (DUF2303 family)
MSDLTTPGDADAVIDLATRAALPFGVAADENGNATTLIHTLPSGASVSVTDLERYLPAPRRARGTVRPQTVEAFSDYVTRHAEPGTTIWVDGEARRLTAILDDHHGVAPGTEQVPGHGEHRAVLDLAHTPEWNHWVTNDCRKFTQSDFAEHIEDGAAEIVVPNAAEMLELASSFHARSSAVFRSAKRLQSGEVQMQYDEEVTATAGKSGDLVVPSDFTLAVAPFVGEPSYKLTARLRYRISSGTLSLSYKLDRPHEVIRHALADIASRLDENLAVAVFAGSPR